MDELKGLEKLTSLIKNEFKPNVEQATGLIAIIRNEIRSYIQENNIKSLVIGVSGGLDSAVVAALCQEKYTGVPLIGLHIPLATADKHSEQADWVGKEYCNRYDSVCWLDEEIDGIATNILLANEKIANDIDHRNVRQGNIKARMRMITLYDMARLNDGIVLSTDNYSEFLAGFWTLHGDVGDFAPIQYIYKGLELPVIAEVLGVREDIITQSPSDGLSVTEENTDEAQLGCDYETFDTIMIMTDMDSMTLIRDEYDNTGDYFGELDNLFNNVKHQSIVQNVIKRHEGTHFKRNGCPEIVRRQLANELKEMLP